MTGSFVQMSVAYSLCAELPSDGRMLTGYPNVLYQLYGVTTVDALIEALDSGAVSLFKKRQPGTVLEIIPKLISKGYAKQVIYMVTTYQSLRRKFQFNLELAVARQLILCHQRFPGEAERFVQIDMHHTLITRLLSELPMSEKLIDTSHLANYCELLVKLGADCSYRNYRIIRKAIHNGYFDLADSLIASALASTSETPVKPSKSLQCLIEQLHYKKPQNKAKSAKFLV